MKSECEKDLLAKQIQGKEEKGAMTINTEI